MLGLHPIFRNDDGEEVQEEADRQPWLSADEFAIFLQRCELHKLRVLNIFHRSESEDLARFWSRGGWTSPAKVFAKWRKEGCRELFGATVDIPEDLLGDGRLS
jgi:hypothetical protein